MYDDVLTLLIINNYEKISKVISCFHSIENTSAIKTEIFLYFQMFCSHCDMATSVTEMKFWQFIHMIYTVSLNNTMKFTTALTSTVLSFWQTSWKTSITGQNLKYFFSYSLWKQCNIKNSIVREYLNISVKHVKLHYTRKFKCIYETLTKHSVFNLIHRILIVITAERFSILSRKLQESLIFTTQDNSNKTLHHH